jgi:hypothetical protein
MGLSWTTIPSAAGFEARIQRQMEVRALTSTGNKLASQRKRIISQGL